GIIQIGELIWCPGIRYLPGKVIITDLTLSRRCGGTFQYRFKGDAANLLKPALARGTLRTIGATTWSEYKRHIEKDPALTRRFQV
ncbi:hypothetical protein MJM59_32475, partial [Salmonella enterica subsp. enterica serovar Montevideo]|nr:hypothetical protein [Salmonella enterica subsp. enterica serovar Montevideo]